MAWKEVEVKIGGKSVKAQKRTTKDEFVFPFDTNIKESFCGIFSAPINLPWNRNL